MVGYVQAIYETLLAATKKDLENAAKKLKEISPEPMNSMLTKQPKTEAIAKHKQRKIMVTQDVPPTTPGNELSKLCSIPVCIFLIFALFISVAEVQRTSRTSENTQKAKPHCKQCKHPMRGHKYVTDCPRNSNKQ